MTDVAFRLDPLMELTDEVFLKLCQANPDINFESTAQGELIVVPPTGGENGAHLGWLINPKSRQVEIYRQGEQKEYCTSPTKLSGEQVLPGFVLDLKGIL